MLTIEIFCGAGGMAEGFRRAGLEFDLALDQDSNACDSYEANLGQRPLEMDIRDLLRLIIAGWRSQEVSLIVADPPCTPWSRAGKRRGLKDDRDMLRETVELVRALRPQAWLIGNVPGLDDSNNWVTVVQPVIGSLTKSGYCIDYQKLDAANYGIVITCPLHDLNLPINDAEYVASVSRAATELESVVVNATTNSEDLQIKSAFVVVAHLAKEIRAAFADAATLRGRLASLLALARKENKTRTGKVDDAWTREVMSVCGWSPDIAESIALWLKNCWEDRSFRKRWSITSTEIQPTTIQRISRSIATTVTTGTCTGTAPRSAGCGLCLDDGVPQHRIRPFWFGHKVGSPCIRWPKPTHGDPSTIGAAELGEDRKPWVTCREALQHLPEKELGRLVRATRNRRCNTKQKFGSDPSKPARGVGVGSLSDGNVLLLNAKHLPSDPDQPVKLVSAGGSRHQSNSVKWPWDRPGTTIRTRDELAQPGRDGRASEAQGANVIILSEKAAAILQGFPETWVFAGKTKKARWSQIGQAIPPALAQAVATSIVEGGYLPCSP